MIENKYSKKKYHWKKKKNGLTEYHITCAYCGKEVIYNHGYKPLHCPNCGAPNYRKPPTEVELFHLQTKYLETRDKEILSEIYLITVAYSKSIIKKTLPSEFTHHYSLIDEKAADVANLLIEAYLSKPAFMIEQSFAGYLQNKVKEVLWNKVTQKEESIGSLEVSDYLHSDDIVDISEVMKVTPAFNSEEVNDSYSITLRENDDIVDGILELITAITNEVKKNFSVYLALVVLYGIHLKIRKASQDEMNLFYKRFGSNVHIYIERAMILIFDFLKEGE